MQRAESGGVARREPEANQPALPALVHLLLQHLHMPVAGGDGFGFPRPGRRQHEGVEGLVGEPGSAGQGIVATLDRGPQPVPQARVDGAAGRGQLPKSSGFTPSRNSRKRSTSSSSSSSSLTGTPASSSTDSWA
jgi:hypothetical protein